MTIADPMAPVATSDISLAQTGKSAGWKTVLASSFGLSVGPSCLTILAFGAFIAPLEAEFKWGVPTIAFGASIISIMIMILSPIEGALVDKFGGRRVILVSIPFFAASLCMMYFLPNNVTIFYLAWILIPIFGLGVWPVSYLRTTAGWFDKKLGLALGIANAGIGFGTMLVPLITGYLIVQYGWREAYLGLGLLAFLAWPVTYFLLSDPVQSQGAVALTGDTLKEAARTRPFWMAAAAFLLLGLFTTGLIVHQVKIMLDAGIPAATATKIPAAFGLALLLGRLLTGWLLDRFSAASIMGILMMGGVISTLLFASGPTVPQAIICVVLTGLITGAEFDVLSYIIPRYHGRKSFGQIYGTLFAIFQLTGAIGVTVLGSMRASTGSYNLSLYILAGVCVLTAILFMLLGPYRFKAGQQA